MRPTLSTTRLVQLLAILSNLFFYCSELPLIRLAEHKICQQHYGHSPSHSSTERDCRAAAIQDQVAAFIGLRTAFDAIPPLLVSLWYGSTLNPKTIITLACTGELLNLGWVILLARGDYAQDVRLAWLAALFLFVGGGQFLLYAMFGLIIVKVTPPQNRAKDLATLHSITLISSLFGAPLSGLLLRISLDTAFFCVVALALARYPVIMLLQDFGGRTVHPTVRYPATTSEETEVLIAANAALNTHSGDTIRSRLITLIRVPTLMFSFMCFLLKRVAFTSEILMYQAIAERLGQPVRDTAWLRIPIGLGATLTLWVILPIGLRRMKLSLSQGLVAEAWAVRLNLIVLVIGFGLFSISNDLQGFLLALTLCGVGEGLAPALQTLASSIVHTSEHESLFAVISTVDTIAKLIGGPIMAQTFSIRDSRGKSYGYCFVLSSILFALMLCLSFMIPLPQLEQSSVDHS